MKVYFAIQCLFHVCDFFVGSDFIKTSTGKEGVNAILPVGLVMVRAIREYYKKTGVKVGGSINLYCFSQN